MSSRLVVLSTDQWQIIRGFFHEAVTKEGAPRCWPDWREQVARLRDRMDCDLQKGLTDEELAHAAAIGVYHTAPASVDYRDVVQELLFEPTGVIRNRGVVAVPKLDEWKGGKAGLAGWTCAATMLMACDLCVPGLSSTPKEAVKTRARLIEKSNPEWAAAAAAIYEKADLPPVWGRDLDELYILERLIAKGARMTRNQALRVLMLMGTYPKAEPVRRLCDAVVAAGIALDDMVQTATGKRSVIDYLERMRQRESPEARVLAETLRERLFRRYLQIAQRAPEKAVSMPGL